jgi:superoxide reductase
MTEIRQVYRCNVCGNIVEVVNSAGGTLVCCGQPMELLSEKTADLGLEKHLPVIEKTAEGFKVKIGSIEHPMEQKHFIKFIELLTEDRVYRKELKPGDKPEAEFHVSAKSASAREYCTVHGLWKKE